MIYTRAIIIATRLLRTAPFTRSTGIWALAVLLWASGAAGTQITGVIKDPAGNGINGRIVLQLSQPGQDTVNHVQIAPVAISYPLSNGVPPTFANVIGNDTIQPTGTYYVVRFISTAGAVISTANFVITGVTFDMGQAMPTTVTTDNVSYLNPITPDQDTTFTGHITFTGPVGGVQQVAIGTAFTSTAFTSELVTVPGLNLTAHCVLGARNALAATNIATTYVSAINAGGTITVTHVATAGMIYDVVCTPHLSTP